MLANPGERAELEAFRAGVHRVDELMSESEELAESGGAFDEALDAFEGGCDEWLDIVWGGFASRGRADFANVLLSFNVLLFLVGLLFSFLASFTSQNKTTTETSTKHGKTSPSSPARGVSSASVSSWPRANSSLPAWRRRRFQRISMNLSFFT